MLAPEPGQPSYRASPQIRNVHVDSIGGSVRSEHSDIAGHEVLGTSTGKADQVFVVRETPVLPRRTGETVQVTIRDDVQNWTEVADFVGSGPNDRHFTWDSTTGDVRFGPLIRYPDGDTRQHGAVPPEAATIAVTSYRFGGGAGGNVGAGTLNALRSTIPYVDRVENITAAIGGVDAESVENAKLPRPALDEIRRPGGDRRRLRASRSRSRPVHRPGALSAAAQCGEPIRLLVVPAIDQPGAQLSSTTSPCPTI